MPVIRGPSQKPSRFVTDYTADEVAGFREEYRPLAAEYRRRSRVAGLVVASSWMCIFLGMTLPWPFALYFWADGICCLAVCLFSRKRVPKCPACRRSPDAGLGGFCPDCGCRGLEPSPGWFSDGPKCRACGRCICRGRGGRMYKLRFCTHCGLGLDDRGL